MKGLTTVLRFGLATVFVVCALGLTSSIGAQQPAAPLPGQTSAASPAQPEKPPAPDVFSYNPEGRRDPFVSLLFRGGDAKPSRDNRPDGLPGMLISEIVLRGILKDKTGFVAMVSGPDNKTHIIRGNDKVYDGTVKAITADSVIFSQDVNDPLSLVKQREVRKYLRTTQEGK